MGMQRKRVQQGYTIIEVMLFFAVTGALMLGVLGSASIGVNTQRYNDAVNTFQAVVQQEFTNATNVVNTESVNTLCSTLVGTTRGTSDCVIIGRLMTIANNGDITKANLVGTEPATAPASTAREIGYVAAYNPVIDSESIETGKMSWGTNIQRAGLTSGANVSVLIVRSPRSGNVYSYVRHSAPIIESTTELQRYINDELVTQASPQNAEEQYMCVDRSGWVLTPVRVITLSPYASGPSGVGVIEEKPEANCS